METTFVAERTFPAAVEWVNGHTIFEERSVGEIRHLWMERRPTNGATHVYVHGPFCAQLCSFCMHQGLKAGGRRDAIHEYYKRYLPSHLSEFSDVLSSSNIQAIYFGGGTADIMSVDDIPRIFGTIPNFKTICCKDSVKFGADAFISKPFDVEKLFTHCFKLGPIILE